MTTPFHAPQEETLSSTDAPEQTASDRRRWLRQAGALVLTLGAGDLAFGATLVAVRVWPSADYTRVTLESDVALEAQHFITEGPARLVIDIDGLELSAQLRELVARIGSDDPQIAGVRIGQNQPRRVRMVFDLKRQVAPQVFTLAPISPYRHRLVFDLYPSKAPDPLLTLVKERESAPVAKTPVSASGMNGSASSADSAEASQRAASDIEDALGEFIGRVDRPVAPQDGATVPPPASPSRRVWPPRPPPRLRKAHRRCRRVAAASTGWSSSRSIRAMAGKTPARSDRPACARRMSCCRSPGSCRNASTPARACVRC